jgi:hypothetical protein
MAIASTLAALSFWNSGTQVCPASSLLHTPPTAAPK